jgi:tetratricopeptide (TPR) repeat protein
MRKGVWFAFLGMISLLFAQLPSELRPLLPSHWHTSRYAFLKVPLPSQERMTSVPSFLQEDFHRFQAAYSAFQLLNKDAHDQLFSYQHLSSPYKTAELACFYDAYLHFLEKAYDKAYALLLQVSEERLSYQEKQIYWFLRGYCHYYREEYLAARGFFSHLTKKLNPYHHSATYYDGLCAFHLHLYSEALQQFLTIEKVPEYEKEVPYLIAFCLLELGEWKKLKAYVQEVEPKNVNHKHSIALALASALFRERRYAEAVPYFESYLKEVSQPEPSAAYQAGYCFLIQKDYARAKALLLPLSEREDTLGQASAYYLGFALNALGQKEEARLAFHRAFSLHLLPPIEADALIQYAKVSFDLHYYDEAYHAFQTFLTRYPDHPQVSEVHKYLGDLFLFSRQYEKAIAYYRKSNLQHPVAQKQFQYACYYHAMDLFNRGQVDSALFFLQMAQNVEGDETFALEIQFWTAESYAHLKNFSMAVRSYKLFLKHERAPSHPRYVDACLGLGWIYLQQKQLDLAIATYEKVLQFSPTPPAEKLAEANVRIGDASYLMKDYSKALRAYEKALTLSPHYEDYALYQLGRVHFRLKQYQQSATAYEKLIQRYPFSPYREQSLLEIAELYLTWLQDYSKAEYYAKQLLIESPQGELNAKAHLILAACAYSSGDMEKAKREFLFVLDTYGRDQTIAKSALEGLSNLLEPSAFDSLYQEYRKRFPNVNPALESVVYETLVKYHQEKKYEDLIRKGKLYLMEHKNGKFYEEVLLMLAQSATALKDTGEAVNYLQQLLKEGFDPNIRLQGRKLLCSILLNQKDTLAALPHLLALMKEETNPYDFLQNAFILVDIYVGKSQWDSAQYYLYIILKAPVLTKFSQHKAQLLTGYVAYMQGKQAQAKETFEALVKEAKDVFGAQALFYLTQIALEQKDFQKVHQYAMRFKEEYPTYNYWKAKAFILLGDSYYAQGKKMEATEIWKSVASSVPYADVKEAVQKRLSQHAQ